MHACAIRKYYLRMSVDHRSLEPPPGSFRHIPRCYYTRRNFYQIVVAIEMDDDSWTTNQLLLSTTETMAVAAGLYRMVHW